MVVDARALMLTQDMFGKVAGELDPHDRFEVGATGEAPLAGDAMQREAVPRPESFYCVRVLRRASWRAAQPLREGSAVQVGVDDKRGAAGPDDARKLGQSWRAIGRE